jgi:hypothetical protein
MWSFGEHRFDPALWASRLLANATAQNTVAPKSLVVTTLSGMKMTPRIRSARAKPYVAWQIRVFKSTIRSVGKSDECKVE